MKIRRSLLQDTVSVETYTGDGAYGPVYGAAVAVDCRMDATRKLVRDSNGDESVSERTLYIHPDDSAYFTPESRVTASSRVSLVMAVNPHTVRGNTVHVEVSVS